MKIIHIAITNEKHVLCIPCPSATQQLLGSGEMILKNWYYDRPKGLENFLVDNPVEGDYFAKAFAYWVLCKAAFIKENENSYGMLKRKLSKFSKKLFRAVKNLAARIAVQVREFFFKAFPKEGKK